MKPAFVIVPVLLTLGVSGYAYWNSVGSEIRATTAIKFSSLPLHDAILKALYVDWMVRTCSADVEVFVARDQEAQPRKIIWQKVRKIILPHEDPWGPSVFINAVRQDEHCYIIEMQSGDEIRIDAETVDFL